MKIPRKLKKELKKAILSKIDASWRSKDVRIDKIKNTSYPSLKQGFGMFKGTIVTSYRLI